MNLILLYFIGCVFVAIVMLYEAYMLRKNDGELKKTPLLTVLSVFEFSWILISSAVLYKLELVNIMKVVPTLYILESFLGWFYGFYLLHKAGVLDELADDEDATIIIPKKYTDFTQSFAMVFLVISILAVIHTLNPTLFFTAS